MKGIILAGGAGSRLYPMTEVCTKQLQPIYDKPMIYYPLSQLMLCGIRDILIISTPKDLPAFKNLLGDGHKLGIHLHYKEQLAPKGISEAFLIGKDFIANDDVTLILGDNLFYGNYSTFRTAINNQSEKKDSFRGRIFAYQVLESQHYGVVEFDETSKKILSIEEKPIKPKSQFAIPGLYIFDQTVCERAARIKPSARGELEIIDVIKSYWEENLLFPEIIGRGMAWLDTGTPQSLLEASSFIGAIEQRQGLKVACLEEVAYRMHYIDKNQFINLIEKTPKSSYQQYLKNIINTIGGGV